MQKFKVLIVIALISSTVFGCSSKDNIIPTPEHTMKTVYERHMGAMGNGALMDHRSMLRRDMTESDIDLTDYVRTEKNALESKFKLLPNPTLYMFVSPNLASTNKIPIPGYLTEFKMYTTEHYALPGEVSSLPKTF